jgi:hypothetical protein
MPAQQQEYFVLIDSMKNPGGHRIYKGSDGQRRVKMTPAAAKYWIDQGAIGTAPKDSLSDDNKARLKQMHRT